MKKIIYLLLVVFLSTNLQSQTSQDREALVAIYKATNGSNWNDQMNWNTSEPIENWGGVDVQNGRVSGLQLFDFNNVSGYLPSEIGLLTELVYLRAFSCNLTGIIPEEIGNLSQLKVLSLEDNNLTGELPLSVWNLTNLETIEIWENEISGILPPEIGQLTKLKIFIIWGCNYSSSIPPEIGNLTDLKLLNLGNNNLSGQIPEELYNLTYLEELVLTGNQLNSTLSPSILNLTNLRKLYLDYSGMIGSLPHTLGLINNLETLWLEGNQFEGNIPSEIGNLSNLLDLNLSSNQLSGVVPLEIGNLNNLKTLMLQDNNLFGELPSSVWKLTNLEKLELWENDISGILSPEIEQFTKLRYFNIWNCNFSGSIPAEIGSLADLELLVLGANEFSGEVPIEIFNLTKLRDLQLPCPQLTGPIPESIANLTQLEVFLIGNASFTELPNLTGLTNLEEITIQGNYFTFEDIEPNISLFDEAWRYNYQRKVSEDVEIDRSLGEGLTLECNVGGNYNRYQWYKDWSPIGGGTNPILQLNSITSSDAGSYHCEVRNDIVPDMFIETGFFNLKVENYDRDALISIYYATNGRKWNDQMNWNTSEPIENWGGVNVDHTGRVVELNLFQGNNVQGTIPDEIGLLTELRGISFDGVNLSGNIPASIGNLLNLEYIQLSRNQLEGELPDEFYNLVRLYGIWLSENNLSGEIKDEIGNFSKLLYLQLERNNFSGDFPSSITNCTQIQQIELWDTELGGEFPQNIGNLNDLQYLVLWNCNFYGQIPDNIRNCANLEVFNLGNNQLTGVLPDGFFELTNLTDIQLQGMNIGGPIKKEITNFTDLATMYLDHSNFTELPDMSSLENLTEFNVQGNRLTFEDIEPNISLFDEAWRYQYQRKVSEDISIDRKFGESITLECNVGGSYNNYQWYKDWAPIEGANEPIYIDNSLEVNETGAYYCMITNDLVPDMFIESGTYQINVNPAEFENITHFDDGRLSWQKVGDNTDSNYINYSINNEIVKEGSGSFDIDYRIHNNQPWGGLSKIEHYYPYPTGAYDFSDYNVLSFWYYNVEPASKLNRASLYIELYEGSEFAGEKINWDLVEPYYAIKQILDYEPGWNYMEIPLEEFQNMGWWGSYGNGQLDLDQIRTIAFEFSVNGNGDNDYVEGRIIIDELLLKSKPKKEVTIRYECDMTNEIVFDRFDPEYEEVRLRGLDFGSGPGVEMLRDNENPNIYYYEYNKEVFSECSLPAYKFWYSPDTWESGSDRSYYLTQEDYDNGEVTIHRVFNDEELYKYTNTLLTELKESIADFDFSNTNLENIVNNIESEIEKSLDEKYWINGDFLSDRGNKVFDHHKKAIDDLEKAIKIGDNLTDVLLIEMRDELISLDKRLAEVSLNEAIENYENNCVDENDRNCKKDLKEIEKAEEYFATGEEKIVELDYKHAIDDFNKSWEHSSKVYSSMLKESSNYANNNLPIEYNLLQNYPNPFNPTTIIKYAIPEAGNVSIVLYNSLGEEIKTLVNENHSAGNYKYNLDGSGLSSGVYFYRIVSDSYNEVKKMILIK